VCGELDRRRKKHCAQPSNTQLEKFQSVSEFELVSVRRPPLQPAVRHEALDRRACGRVATFEGRMVSAVRGCRYQKLESYRRSCFFWQPRCGALRNSDFVPSETLRRRSAKEDTGGRVVSKRSEYWPWLADGGHVSYRSRSTPWLGRISSVQQHAPVPLSATGQVHSGVRPEGSTHPGANHGQCDTDGDHVRRIQLPCDYRCSRRLCALGNSKHFAVVLRQDFEPARDVV